jgi:hypothetical protein
MAWTPFPYPDPAYRYTPESLKAAWPALHSGDLEPFPGNPALLQAWIAFHAGEFERAARLGLDVGVNGYSVAHKAICIYAQYLEPNEKKRIATFECVAERCERQQREQPDNPAGYYWHAYALGYYALGISVVKGLAQGLGPSFTPPVKAAWAETYMTLAGVMQKAAATMSPSAASAVAAG